MGAQSITSHTPAARLIVDASTLIRWWGPPVGIVRTEAEIVRGALARHADAIVAIYDTRSNAFRPLDRAVALALTEGKAVVDAGVMPDPRPIERAFARALLKEVNDVLRPVLRVRRTLMCVADEWRRKQPDGFRQRAATWLLDMLLSPRMRARTIDSQGNRRMLLRLDAVIGAPLHLTPADTVLCAGSDWGTKNPAAFAALKQRTGFRLTTVCYDLIPILFPQFYGERDVSVFAQYFRAAIGFTDRFVCISKRTAADLTKFAKELGRTGLDIRSERLGCDAAQPRPATAPLPSGLAAGRYVLFVSTIEPRKNHALLLRVWRRLAAGANGGTSGFKLVLAGRVGWMTGDVMAALSDDPVLARDVVHLAGVVDDMLEALYAQAAFCVYPSLYEGFGLPVVEAHLHGKPVIASTGGALPEAADGLAPCLDPNDEDAWTAAIGRWINDPALLAEQAMRVCERFSWPAWPQAVARIIAAAEER